MAGLILLLVFFPGVVWFCVWLFAGVFAVGAATKGVVSVFAGESASDRRQREDENARRMRREANERARSLYQQPPWPYDETSEERARYEKRDELRRNPPAPQETLAPRAPLEILRLETDEQGNVWFVATGGTPMPWQVVDERGEYRWLHKRAARQ
jgi:hypothetical protein